MLMRFSGPISSSQLAGTAMVLVSATGFGTAAILAKIGYESGLGTVQMLAARFVLAAVGMLLIATFRGQNPLLLERSRLAALLAMGMLLYTAQSLSFFLALRSLPASLVALMLYVYPSLVIVAGWVFFRRTISFKNGAALAASFGGIAMLLGGTHFEATWALLLAVVSPIIYTGYILIGERLMSSVPAMAASALIITGAAIGYCLVAALTHQLTVPRNSIGWMIVVAFALFPTMVAISLFLAGLPRVGAARAALLSTWEPVVTVALAILVLGDHLSGIQVLGGLLVMGAMILAQSTSVRRKHRLAQDLPH